MDDKQLTSSSAVSPVTMDDKQLTSSSVVSPVTMDDKLPLPDEALAHIFSFLDSRSKINASSVCKRWMSVFNDYPYLLENVCVYCIESEPREILKTFSTMTRNFCCFYFRSVDIDAEFFLFLEAFAPQFRRLIFDFCEILVDEDRKLHNCCNLSKLMVCRCDALMIFSHLPALKSLRFEISDAFPMRDMEQLQRMTPLSLIDFKMVDRESRDAEDIDMLYAEVKDFIHERRLSLKSLDFRNLEFPDSFVNSLSKMEGLRLKRLKASSNFLSHSIIESFFSNHRWIVALDLPDTSGNFNATDISPIVTDSTVMAICTLLPLLKELNISRCIGVDESIAMIFRLKRLRRLKLCQCRGITHWSFINALNGLECSNLVTLDVCGTSIDYLILSHFLPLVPNLREITLSRSLRLHLDSEWVECPTFMRCSDSGIKFVRRVIS